VIAAMAILCVALNALAALTADNPTARLAWTLAAAVWTAAAVVEVLTDDRERK